MSRRLDRISDLVRASLSRIVREELQDPRVKLASISRVSVTADLGYARVGVSVLGDDESEREQAVTALRRARGYLRRQLARDLRDLRAIPELRFELDRGAEHSQYIEDLLESVDEPSSGS